MTQQAIGLVEFARIFLVLSVVFQIGAAVQAFRLIRTTGHKLAWILISIALVFMAFRRLLPLYYSLSDGLTSVDTLNEGIGMVLSGLMLAGVTLIGPIFKKIFKSEDELAASERRFRSYFELPIVGIAVLSTDFRWVILNDRACDILGYTREELVGHQALEFSPPEDAELEASLWAATLREGQNAYLIDKRFIRQGQPNPIWVNQAVRCVHDPEGCIAYFVTILQDITERKRYEEGLRGSMQEKEILLKELYHRTKNNMQIICSLLNLMGSDDGDAHLVEEFRLIEDRIKSMALVHEMLYQSTDLASIDLADYIEDLSKLLLGNYSSSACKIDFQLDLEPTIVSIEEAIPCGLILNELITNSLIHGFPGRIKGRIAVSLTCREERAVRLTVLDDGIGFPLNGVISSMKGIGLKTVNVLAAQLGGEIQYESNSGSTWILSFVRASHGNVNNLKQVNLLGNYKQASSITVNSCP